MELRGARPDATAGDVWFLFKSPSHLRLTYQIRLLTMMARSSGCRLVIRLPQRSTVSKTLRTFLSDNRRVAVIERVT